MGSNQKTPIRNLNNKIYEYLQRDVDSVEYKEETSSVGRKKVILLDRTKRYRDFAYVADKCSVITAKNNLALSYLTKFNLDFDLRKVGRAPSKVNKD